MLVFLGEALLDKKCQNRIDDIIQALRPVAVVHWRMGHEKITTAKQAKDAIDGAKSGGIVDPRFNLDVFRLARKLLPRTKFYGCDRNFMKFIEHKEQYWKNPSNLGEREKSMASEIARVYGEYKSSSNIVICVVESTSLRKKDSPLYKKFGASKLLLAMEKRDWALAIFDDKAIFEESVKGMVDIIHSVDASKYLD